MRMADVCRRRRLSRRHGGLACVRISLTVLDARWAPLGGRLSERTPMDRFQPALSWYDKEAPDTCHHRHRDVDSTTSRSCRVILWIYYSAWRPRKLPNTECLVQGRTDSHTDSRADSSHSRGCAGVWCLLGYRGVRADFAFHNWRLRVLQRKTVSCSL
jgi:hypothetical protein